MVQRLDASAQILRLAGLPGFNSLTEKAIEELENALLECRDTKHAAEVISAWLRHSHHRKDFVQFLPIPSDLFELSDLVQPAQYTGRRLCELCGGSGFRVMYERHTYNGRISLRDGLPEKTVEDVSFEIYTAQRKVVDGLRQKLIEVASHCECSYGRHLYQAVMARKAQEESDGIERRQKRERAA